MCHRQRFCLPQHHSHHLDTLHHWSPIIHHSQYTENQQYLSLDIFTHHTPGHQHPATQALIRLAIRAHIRQATQTHIRLDIQAPIHLVTPELQPRSHD